jgi:hypothetical protein
MAISSAIPHQSRKAAHPDPLFCFFAKYIRINRSTRDAAAATFQPATAP